MNTIRRHAIGLAGASLAVLSTACLDDRSAVTEPNAAAAAVRIGIKATILGAAAGQTVRIRAFYTRTNGSDVTLQSAPTAVSVTPGVPRLVGVVVHIAACLSDTQRANATSNTCQVQIALTLEDEAGNPIDEQTSPPPPPLPPGGTTTINSPITFAPVAAVSVGAVTVLREAETRTFTASATDAQGKPLPTRTFKWTSDNPGVLAVNATTGAATAISPGSARVTAVTGVKSVTTTVRVIRRVTSVVVNPDPAPVVRAAATASLVAVPKAASGVDAGDLADRTITWAVANPAGSTTTATVTPNGVVTGVYPGDADVTVTVDGVAKTVRLRINAASVAIESSTTLLVVGTTVPLKATVLDAKDAPLANVPVEWSTSDPSVATVSPTGVVTATGQGLAVITATGGGASGTTPMHVTTQALEVQPSSSSVLAGNTLQLSTAATLGPLTWQTSDPSIATVSAAGVVTARFPGNVRISATSVSPFGVQRGSATIVVTVAKLEILPESAVIGKGGTLQFVAVARDTKGAILDVPITWSSGNLQHAPVSSSGLVFGAAPTATTITIAGGGRQATAVLRISDDPGYGVVPKSPPPDGTSSGPTSPAGPGTHTAGPTTHTPTTPTTHTPTTTTHTPTTYHRDPD